MAYISTRLEKEISIEAIVTIHYFEYMRDFVFLGESHDFWEFLYVDKGTVVVSAGQSQHTLNAGDIIFHKPNEFHAIQSIGSIPPNLVAVSFLSSSPALSALYSLYCTTLPEERDIISSLIAQAHATFRTPINVPSVEQVLLKPGLPVGAQQKVTLFLELLLIEIINHHCAREEKAPEEACPLFRRHDSMEKRFQAVRSYLLEHVCEKLSISDLCRTTSLSRASLQGLFHEQAGCGAIEYFNGLKIEKSKELLRSRVKNITEVSYMLSYSTPQHFCNQFKKVTGMAPSVYLSSVKGNILLPHTKSNSRSTRTF